MEFQNSIEVMKRPHVALVTGANRGLGLEVCRQLAAHGHQVVLTARRERTDMGGPGAPRSVKEGHL